VADKPVPLSPVETDTAKINLQSLRIVTEKPLPVAWGAKCGSKITTEESDFGQRFTGPQSSVNNDAKLRIA